LQLELQHAETARIEAAYARLQGESTSLLAYAMRCAAELSQLRASAATVRQASSALAKLLEVDMHKVLAGIAGETNTILATPIPPNSDLPPGAAGSLRSSTERPLTQPVPSWLSTAQMSIPLSELSSLGDGSFRAVLARAGSWRGAEEGSPPTAAGERSDASPDKVPATKPLGRGERPAGAKSSEVPPLSVLFAPMAPPPVRDISPLRSISRGATVPFAFASVSTTGAGMNAFAGADPLPAGASRPESIRPVIPPLFDPTPAAPRDTRMAITLAMGSAAPSQGPTPRQQGWLSERAPGSTAPLPSIRRASVPKLLVGELKVEG
jgi:hypothetical protein